MKVQSIYYNPIKEEDDLFNRIEMFCNDELNLVCDSLANRDQGETRIENLIDDLEKDWEFRLLCNYLYDNIRPGLYNKIIEIIKIYKANIEVPDDQ